MNTSYCTELDIYVTLDSIGPEGLQGPKGDKGDKGDTGAGGTLGYYGSFFDTTDQYITTSLTPQVVQINSTGEASGISLGGNGKYIIENAGTYSMTFSIQLRNTDNVTHYADIWLKYNGEVYPDSNTRFHIPARKSAEVSGYAVATVNFVGTAQNDNDYVELWWLTDDGSMVTMETIPASNGVPETPSVICTFAQVMYTQEGPQGPQGDVGPQGPAVPVINNLTSTSTTDALAANQGKVIKDSINSCFLPMDWTHIRLTNDSGMATGFHPITKVAGNLTVSGNQITFTKGYAYEFFVDITANGNFRGYMILANVSPVGSITTIRNTIVSGNAYNGTVSGSSGYGFLDLTTASANMQVGLFLDGFEGAGTLTASYGGVLVKQYKKVVL